MVRPSGSWCCRTAVTGCAGTDLLRRLDAWVAAGVVEPSCADAVRLVADNPQWLSLPGHRVAVLGAGRGDESR